MGQHLGKREPRPESKPSSPEPEPEPEQIIDPAPIGETMAEPESQDEVFDHPRAQRSGIRVWFRGSGSRLSLFLCSPFSLLIPPSLSPERQNPTYRATSSTTQHKPPTWQLQAPLDCLAWEGKRRPLALWIKLGTSLEGTRRGRARVLSVVCPPLLPDLPRLPLRVGRTLLCASSERSCPQPLLSLGGLRSQQDPLRRRRPVQETAEPCPRSSKWAQAGLGLYPKNEVPFQGHKGRRQERGHKLEKHTPLPAFLTLFIL